MQPGGVVRPSGRPSIPVHDVSNDRNFDLEHMCMRKKYRHMSTIVKTLPTVESTRVFRSAQGKEDGDTSYLFFPWLGLSATEFGIGKVMCSLYHASSAGSVRTRQEKAERIREKRRMEKQHKEAQVRLRKAMEDVRHESKVVRSVILPSSGVSSSAVPVRRSQRLRNMRG